MAKGLFTQGICVLLSEPMTLEELRECLKGFECIGHHESIDDEDGPETLILNYRPEVRGNLLATPSAGQWPDDLGDPDESPERFIAWSLGQYGPFAFPGCLRRAMEQSWGWEEGAEVAIDHVAHVRILISYVLGMEQGADQEGEAAEQSSFLADDDVPLIPEDYDPMDEMRFLMKAVSPIMEHSKAICYFNPGGEVLRDESGLRQGLNYAWSHELPALDMWTNIRLFQAEGEWSLMDTVGNGQLDLPDLEAVFDPATYEPSDVERFLRSASLYMLNSDEVIEDGDTADGAGNVTWKAMECFEGLSDPPRPTIRWMPDDGSTPPAELIDPGQIIDEDADEFNEEELDFDPFADDSDDVDGPAHEDF